MSYLRPNVRRRRVKGMLSGLGSIFTDFAHNVKHAMTTDQKVSLRRPMSGLTSGPRGTRISLVSLDGYDQSSPCSSIPSGDPYRVAPNTCTDTEGNVYTFDSKGSAVLQTKALDKVFPPLHSPDGSLNVSGVLTWGAYGIAGYFAYKALLK